MAPQVHSNGSIELDHEEEALARLHLDDAHTELRANSSGKGGYRYESPEEVKAMKAQRAAVWQWLKGIGVHMLKDGLSLTNISMPVTLFEPRSWLERMCDNWSYLQLLELAADAKDPVDRLKLVVAFAISGLRQQISFGKPFNPILGETFQGAYPNGTQVYIEQIAHHPPISSWQVYDHDARYHFFGNGTWAASARGNSVKGQQTGANTVRFSHDDAEVSWEMPYLTIRGVLFGERYLKYGGSMRFQDAAHGLTCDVDIDTEGPGFFRSFFRRKKAHAQDAVHGVLRGKDGEELDVLTGSWLSHLEWEKGVCNGKLHTVWDAVKTPVDRAIAEREALPSDCRFRNDLVQLKTGTLDAAQRAKVELEQVQRADRRLRSEGLKRASA
ncbi:Oxysterol-binding protein 9 [Auxenochlorella protothecoides]|uniref:Oxysterol-binding protein 9 n=3 Tax=Auxenochlorella protothecoides TaxID=3075 RepID=A0A087SFF8_AUXPR|nr:Oxysterol-binding protein 9 [Auxenochlorella protothecoides]KFM24462.1 Oxysterol-binding protein 9 [Auxenochlorella protothecoides]RMZ54428.1 hypothetical protein APUTEX25_002004 [Auxenochlorella protothecoides]|eukprot:RMZ54428.1 hypothetical protein APUTEX25_002004 [Auxenochlorella protothecoides]